jgi:HEAT repeat protein
MKTLVHELRAGRLDLDDLGDEVGQWEGNQLADLWERLIARETGTPSRSLLQLIPGLAARRHLEPLMRAASHPHPIVRRSCLNALATLGDDTGETALLLGLEDEDASVRLAALRGLMRIRSSTRTLRPVLIRLLDDPDPAVRCEAAVSAGDAGEAVIRSMLRSADKDQAIAAFRCAPEQALDTVLERVEDPDPEVRAAALECIARTSPAPPFDFEALTGISDDENPQVRRAGVMLLANIDEPDAAFTLAGKLGDSSEAVRFAAETVLGSLGEGGIHAVEPFLHANNERTVNSALRAIRNTELPIAREVLRGEFRRRVREAWRDVAAFRLLEFDDGIAKRFLATAITDDLVRNRRIAFTILELLEDRNVVRRIERSLHLATGRSRGDALEILSHMGDREAASLLVLLHEAGPIEDRIPTASEIVSLPSDANSAIAIAEDSENTWIAMAARAVVSAETTTPKEGSLMERLLALKQVPLFSQLSLEQLEAVQRTSVEVEYLTNETIMREGERGGDLYLLIDGRVRVYKGYRTASQTLLSTMTAVSYFGEMAAIDDRPRSATVVAAERSRMLRLDGESLKELIRQMPEISFEILLNLTARVRNAERKLAEMKESANRTATT